MKKTRFQRMKEKTASYYQGEQKRRILENMDREYEQLCRTWDKELPTMLDHAHNNIFPVVAAMQALLAEGMEREEAAKLAGDYFLELMEEIADSIRSMLKLPGLYRLMPRIWKTAMPRLFSEESGFRFKFYPTDGSRVKFDMLECPYYRICEKVGCLDLAPVFCATDDVCYGHMHPRLRWNRTKTIARGADLCDFDLIAEKKGGTAE